MTTTPALNDDLVQSARNQLLLIHSLANDTTEANWADKRLYVMQTCVRLSDDLAALEAQAKEIEALKAALEPSAETKAAYSGEFYERVEISNPNFDEDDENEPETLVQQVPVSWTTIKEIMAAIRARTALTGA